VGNLSIKITNTLICHPELDLGFHQNKVLKKKIPTFVGNKYE